jgi:hypothetical protein
LSGPIFMFCPPGLVFWRYRGRRVPFSCFTLPDSFSALPRALGPVFIFCAPELAFGGIEGVGYHFHVLRARTSFQPCLGRRVPFSCSALPDSISALPRVLGPIFLFCAPGIIFGVTEDVGSRFHVVRARTHFRWCRGHRGLIFMFCAPRLIFGDTEGVDPIFMFRAPGPEFGVTEGVRSPFSCFARPDYFSAVARASVPFSNLRCRTRFRRCRGRKVLF